MNSKTKTIAKGGIATAVAGALALAGATPAFAEHRDNGGISAGDIIAGAVIIGGIAAVASAASNNRYDDYYGRYDDRNRYRESYRYGGSPRSAVERCVHAVERDARRIGYRNADVTQIRDVENTRYGWRVKGRLQVGGGGHDRYDRDDRYDRYDRYDRDDRYDRYEGNDRYYGRYGRGDSGAFTCYIDRGRVADIDYSGLRRL